MIQPTLICDRNGTSFEDDGQTQNEKNISCVSHNTVATLSSLFHSPAPRCIFWRRLGLARLGSASLFITLSDDVKPSVENHGLKLNAIAAIRGAGKQAPGEPVMIQAVLFTEAETYSIYMYGHARRGSWTFLAGGAPPVHRTRERRKERTFTHRDTSVPPVVQTELFRIKTIKESSFFCVEKTRCRCPRCWT